MKSVLFTLALLLNFYLTGSAQTTKPTIEIDHIVITTQKGAPETKLFDQNGFAVSSITGDMMGIGARYVNFYNVFFELLYVNEQSALKPQSDSTMTPPRDKWRIKGESPFGLGLTMNLYDTTQIPFDAQKVQPKWMKSKTPIYAAKSNISYLQEPIMFIVHPSTVKPQRNSIEEIKKDINQWFQDEKVRKEIEKSYYHPNGVKKLTNVKITCKASELSPTIQALKSIKNCQIVKGKEHLLEMTFDGNNQKKTADFRPQLPIKIYY